MVGREEERQKTKLKDEYFHLIIIKDEKVMFLSIGGNG